MIIVLYDAINGTPWRDGEVEHYVAALCSFVQNNPEQEATFTTSTDNLIHGIRVAVKEHRLPLQQVQIQYRWPDNVGDVVMEMDHTGRILNWYEGFCDTIEKYIERLLDWDEDIPTQDIPADAEKWNKPINWNQYPDEDPR